MQYRNKVTGALIDVPCQCSGGEWVPAVQPNQDEAKPKATAKAKTAQKE